MAQGSKTSGKGFLIGAFALVAVLAIVGAYQVSKVLFPPAQPAGPRQARSELLSHLLYEPQASFPGSVAWGTLFRLGEGLPSPPGWEIRYNAAASLARRGSPKTVEVFGILREMLDEEQQMKNFRIQLKDGTSAPNEEVALGAVLIALKAVADWHKHAEVVQAIGSDNSELRKLYQAIDKLGESNNRVVSTEAKKVHLALSKNKPS